MKQFLLAVGITAALIMVTTVWLAKSADAATPPATVAQGGTGSTTVGLGQVLFGQGTSLPTSIRLGSSVSLKFATSTGTLSVTYASTTAVSGTSLCIGTDCRTGWPSSGGGTFPFTQTLYGSQNVNSTSTGLWFTGSPLSAIASSTFTTFASTTLFGSSGATWLTGTKNAALSTDNNGLVVASTTGIVTAGTGISLDSSVRQIFGGALAISNSGVTSNVAGSGITVSGATGAVTITATFPFTPTTSFGSTANSTSTLTLFTLGITASSTTRFGIAGQALSLIMDSNGRLGLGSTTPSILFGNSIGTSTVFGNTQFGGFIASSTAVAASYTVNWETSNTQRFILNQNTTFVINATSSNPRDGFAYKLKICQDPTGSRTATFVTPGQLRWTGGTTTVSSAANTCTWIGMVYDATALHYDVLASSTSLLIN